MNHQVCLTCRYRDTTTATCSARQDVGPTQPDGYGRCAFYGRTRPIPWTEKETEMLYGLCGRYGIEQSARMLNEKFWFVLFSRGLHVRTYTAVRGKMRELHIDHRYVSGDLTVADAARELGIEYRRLLRKVKYIMDKHRKSGGKMDITIYQAESAIFIKQEDVPKLAAFFPKYDGMYTLEEAASRLGYSVRYMRNIVRAGAFPGAVRSKGRWFLQRMDIERLVVSMIQCNGGVRQWDSKEYTTWRQKQYDRRKK